VQSRSDKRSPGWRRDHVQRPSEKAAIPAAACRGRTKPPVSCIAPMLEAQPGRVSVSMTCRCDGLSGARPTAVFVRRPRPAHGRRWRPRCGLGWHSAPRSGLRKFKERARKPVGSRPTTSAHVIDLRSRRRAGRRPEVEVALWRCQRAIGTDDQEIWRERCSGRCLVRYCHSVARRVQRGLHPRPNMVPCPSFHALSILRRIGNESGTRKAKRPITNNQ
jgi:hypothetical protein